MSIKFKIGMMIPYLALLLASCGKLKTADQASLDSTTPSPTPVSATQVYTNTSALIGNYLGLLGANSLLVQFPDGAVGIIDTVNYGSNMPLLGIPGNLDTANAGLKCTYSSSDCSGDCLVRIETPRIYGLMQGSVTYNGSQYLVYSGTESTFTLASGSSRSFVPDSTTGVPTAGSCSTFNTNTTVVKPSRALTLPNGLAFPIQGFSFRSSN
ncbi:hypothetical protein [Bdellovibrio sp. NC01]|uniref:hypothetical protein n=1 Tax=Bdellovibrio sp. NC01 TaxID=2220073 RepID=UPI0011598446|nr:hypothetical protein [Bdellovibrio sp. NC01]QDK36405.1 hypothetical protein DOE51_01710 [Bdellovibrio sp. NC01]